MILTAIGEIGVYAEGGVNLVLRPSLYAMSKIGTPREIVEVYALVMYDGELNKRDKDNQFCDALTVVKACCESDVTEVFGEYVEENEGVFVYRPAMAEPEHILPLARHLLRHGITGIQKPLPVAHDGPSEYTGEFDAKEHVAMAQAHLGMNEKEAWMTTMTSLVGAMRMKFPPTKDNPGIGAPSVEDHDATMEWFEQIDAKRKAKAKVEG